MIDLKSLKNLSIGKMQGLSCLRDSVGPLLMSLEDLSIYACEQLLCLWRNEAVIEENMTCLRRFDVTGCSELVSCLTAARIKKMVSLQVLIVKECPNIGSIQVEQQQIEQEEVKDEVSIPGKLKHVELYNGGDQLTEFLVDGIMILGEECVLEHLKIGRCESLRHLAITSRKECHKVKHMELVGCENLVTLSNSGERTTKLVKEAEDDQDQRENIPKTNFVEIGKLDIQYCQSLTKDGMKSLVAAVKELKIEKCNHMESLAEESVIVLDEKQKTNMQSTVVEIVTLWSCPNLKSLSDRLHQLTNLRELELCHCDGLEYFPERGLPIPNLRDLRIEDCKNLKSLPKNIHSLRFLEEQSVFLSWFEMLSRRRGFAF